MAGNTPQLPAIGYKPGWSFKRGGPNNGMLCILANTTDSQDHDSTRYTQHMFQIPEGPDRHQMARFVLDCLLLCEQHECCEFLTVDGTHPFFPHHQDEGSPYIIVDRWKEVTE